MHFHDSFKLQFKQATARFLRCPPKSGAQTSSKSRPRASNHNPGPPLPPETPVSTTGPRRPRT